jgi:hypothetical protein
MRTLIKLATVSLVFSKEPSDNTKRHKDGDLPKVAKRWLGTGTKAEGMTMFAGMLNNAAKSMLGNDDCSLNDPWGSCPNSFYRTSVCAKPLTLLLM